MSAARAPAARGAARASPPSLAMRPVLVLAGIAGLGVAAAGAFAGTRAVYYVAIVGFAVAALFAALTRPEPARFAFLLLALGLPFAELPVPPGRLGIRVFDVVGLALAAALLARRWRRGQRPEPLLPSPAWAVAWGAFLVCVAASPYPADSLPMIAVAVALYAFFLYALEELRREGGFERLAALWSVVLLLASAGLVADHLLQLNLSGRGANLNQMSRMLGTEIWRAGGFFQDPQKAGAFLAALVTFLLVAAVRGRFAGRRLRYLVWVAVAAGIAALMTTISRGAIVACLGVSALALLLFNRWQAGLRLAAIAAVAAAAAGAAIAPATAWQHLLPEGIGLRFAYLAEELEIRMMIWFDTWDMFARHPLTGIGPGGFRSYLLDTRPGMTGYYGIGVSEGAAYVPEQPESGYLKVLYEGGLLGAGALLLLLGAALRRAFAALARPAAPEARAEVVAVLAALATSAATFATLFTVGDSRIAALNLFLLAVIWHRSRPVPRPGRP